MSRFFTTGSDSETESSASGDEPAPKPAGGAYGKPLLLSEDEEDTKRVVRSARDKRFEELSNLIRTIRNAMKIRDVTRCLEEWEALGRAYAKARGVLDRDGAPRCYIRILADLEDYLNELWEDKEGKRRMSKPSARALGTLRQKLRKHNRDFEAQISAYRQNPEQSDEDEEKKSGDSEGSSSSDSDEDADVSSFLKKKEGGGDARGRFLKKLEEEEEDEEESSDEDWGSDDSDTDSESDEDDGKFTSLASKFLKKDDDKRGGERKREEKAKKKLDRRSRRYEEEDEEGDGEWERVRGGVPLVKEKPKMFAKGTEITPAVVVKKLNEILQARGKKGTDRAGQVELLQLLVAVVQEQGLGVPLELKVKFNIVASLYDSSPNLAACMKPELWQKCLGCIEELLELLFAHPDIFVGENIAEESENLANPDQPFRVRGCILTLVERMDEEFTKIMQSTDPHSQEYVEHLKDEARVCAIIARLQRYLQEKGSTEELCRVFLRRILHTYYKFDYRAQRRADPHAGGGDPKSGGGDPKSGVGDTKSGGGEPKVGVGDTKIGVGEPKIGVGDLKVGVGDPKVGGDPKTSGGDPKVGVGDPKSSGGDGSGGSGDPKMEEKDPKIGGDLKVGGGDPKTSLGDPKIGGGDPKIGGGDPKIGGGDLKVEGGEVREGDGDLRGGGDPKMEENDPNVGGGEPKIGGGDPKIGGGELKVGGEALKVGGEDLKVGGDPKIGLGEAKTGLGDLKVGGGEAKSGGEDLKAEEKEKGEEEAKEKEKVEVEEEEEEDSAALMERLCKFIYAKDRTDRIRTCAILCHIYHHALHSRWYQARDLMLMSHLQDNIQHADPPVQILYNRTMVQLGICAFREGLIKDAHNALLDIQSSGRAKELLGQGLLLRSLQERNPEQEKVEKRRQVPFHMHVNLELLECVYLVAAMLLEIPYMAAHEFDARRRMISKQFHHQLRVGERQPLLGPPESMREHVVAASKAMKTGDWRSCHRFVVNEKMNGKVWDLFPEANKVRAMLVRKIQEESLRTYLFTYSSVYDSISMEILAAMFELDLPTVHSIISKMIINEELMASLDQPTQTVMMHRTEPTPQQNLALQLAEKLGGLVENNERVFDHKQGSYGGYFRDQKDGYRKGDGGYLRRGGYRQQDRGSNY